ncbi:Eco57I restriction-modification methylase domain-containing protein [Phreatobacter sp. HK31-P]
MPPYAQHQGQLAFHRLSLIDDAVAKLAEAGAEERGAIFTRREVVDFILDLAGYTADQPLHRRRLLEPSVGEGDFLFPALERLFAAYSAAREKTNPVLALKDAIRTVELHRSTCEGARAGVVEYLQRQGLSVKEASTLAGIWVVQGDFLLTELEGTFTHVVGNPPYVRQESVPDILMAEYRARYRTIYDRADLYVPFIERGLSLLSPNGRLAFICADRWMKNRYGAPLREFVAADFRLQTYVDMVDTPAFHSDVIAYPAIFVIGRGKAEATRVAHRPAIDGSLPALARALRDGETHAAVSEARGVAAGAEPWLLDSPDQLTLVRRLERDFPLLEDAGCKVGIGVATGADQVFIGKFDELDVEDDRKLPMAMSRDIASGTVSWRGYGVLNPFDDAGKLVPLAGYPRFAAYLERHGQVIKARHVSQKNPDRWYRTIDRIYPELTYQPKLLIPDIKGEANIVYEDGKLYPHHNLYYITAAEWDLRALQAVLQSGIARLFVSTYSTKMRGGYLRFQAQYLRRIRIPHWVNVPDAIRRELSEAAGKGDKAACDDAVFRLYGLTRSERSALGGNGG